MMSLHGELYLVHVDGINDIERAERAA